MSLYDQPNSRGAILRRQPIWTTVPAPKIGVGRCLPLCGCSACPASSLRQVLTKTLPHPYRNLTGRPLAVIGGRTGKLTQKGELSGSS